MSLGTFFRDYVYIPLGGNRKNKTLNLFIVWFLTGLWHGSSWNFIAWGIYYFALISFENIILSKVFRKIPAVFSHIYLIIAVIVGWVFFYFTDLSYGLGYLGIMFGQGGNPLIDTFFEINFTNNLYIILVAIIACTPFLKTVKQYIRRALPQRTKLYMSYSQIARPLINFTILAVSTILLIEMTYNPFLYFRF